MTGLMRIVKAISWFGILFVMTACSEDVELYDEVEGYFRTDHNLPSVCYVESDKGEIKLSLYGRLTEDVIPIVLLANDEKIFDRPSAQWPLFESLGAALRPSVVYTEDGYDSYPNTIDYRYTFMWASFSTYKEYGVEEGVISVSFESNPYNVPRMLAAYLSNEDSGTLVLIQTANSDGVFPPDGTLSPDGYYIGPE